MLRALRSDSAGTTAPSCDAIFILCCDDSKDWTTATNQVPVFPELGNEAIAGVQVQLLKWRNAHGSEEILLKDAGLAGVRIDT